MLAQTLPPESLPPDGAEMLALGVIESVDRAAGECVVRMGEIVSGPVPWIERSAGETVTWLPPSVGQQVVVLAPEGEIQAALVLGGVFSNAHPVPAHPDRDAQILFKDGAALSYDATAHRLEIILPGGGALALTAPGGVDITGPVSITGDLSVEGTVTASDDVEADGISLVGHTHNGVAAGSASTGAPQ